MGHKMRYRLGLDIGAKSIGWAMLRLDNASNPTAIIRMGVRIFRDGRNPKDGTSLAVTRRMARQARRRRDRLLRRKERLTAALIGLGFFPGDPGARRGLVALDPYELRRKGLDAALTPAEFARALFHINQRRGFKSNRRTDRKDSDSGTLKVAIRRVREQLAASGARTVGEWLAQRHAKREGVRARLRGRTAKGRAYDLYIDRSMIEAEFDALWAKQAEFNPAVFTEEARIRLKDILLFQRPLKPVDPGRCTFLPDERRAPLAMPIVQRFRIYQEVNNLRILGASLEETALTVSQRDAIVTLLERSGDVTFARICRTLKLPTETRFNLQDGKRDRLKGNATGALLAKEKHFGANWHEFAPAKQDEIVSRLLTVESEAALVDWLIRETGIDEQRAEAIANARLPEGYGNLSRAAVERILPHLQAGVVSYAHAVVAAGFESHSALSHSERTGELMRELPYYGEALQRHVAFGSGLSEDPPEKRYGRIANPTVHIGLNELRKVVNALIVRYGNPSQVVVEVARELKQGKARRDEVQREQAQRQLENERYSAEIRELLGGVTPIVQDIQRMRLWVELNPADPANRRCPYTGEQIGLDMLFSDAVEVDHILPFARTLDDSLNNKTVAMRRANRDKGNNTPFEAFGHSPAGYDFAAILDRAKLMPRAKAKRFAADGYENWLKDDKDFLARALNDTAYLSRVAKEYLTLICPPSSVWVIPGRLTSMLRGKYGLDSLLSGSVAKNRHDHRHHAIDAAVIGITDRHLLQRFASANASARERGIQRLVERMPFPWPTYRDHVSRALNGIVVSFRPDHGYQGGLHNETAYGIRDGGFAAHRVPLDKFKSHTDLEKAEFADRHLKEWLLEQVAGLDGKELAARIDQITRDRHMRRARIIEPLSIIPIREPRATARHGTDEDGASRAYKGYKGDSNYCIEVWRDTRGNWQGNVVSTFQAYQIVRSGGWPRLRDPRVAQNGQPLVMRLMIDDTLEAIFRGARRLLQVCKIGSNGSVFLAQHNEANIRARADAKESDLIYGAMTARSLQKARACRVTVSPIGIPTRYVPAP